MRYLGRVFVVALLFTFVLMPVLGGAAMAAVSEKSVKDEINTAVAVLRYFYLKERDAKENLELVRAARDLTEKQHETMKLLYEKELAAGNNETAEIHKVNLDKLAGQLEKLKEFDFETIFAARVDALSAQKAEVTLHLEARMKEYETLFGERPRVALNFEEEKGRYRGKRAEAAFFLDLGR